MSTCIYEKEGGESPVYMCISTCTLGESRSGGMLSPRRGTDLIKGGQVLPPFPPK